MKWVTYISPVNGQPRAGVLHGQSISGGPPGRSLIDALSLGNEGMFELAEAMIADPDEVVPISSAKLLAPVPVPPSIRDFMAFEDHALRATKANGVTLSQVWYELPAFYFTNPRAVRAHRDQIAISPGSTWFDYELEVAAVISKPGADIAVDDAGEHIGGFMLMSDWSARDLQAQEMKVGLGPVKSKDTATSFGPWMVTPDELAEVRTSQGYDIAMTADVNGARYSAGNWSSLYWTFEQMISYASRGTPLVNGDIIGSGTVGTGCILELATVHGLDKYPWLKENDQVTLAASVLGSIESTIVLGGSPKPLTSNPNRTAATASRPRR